VKALRWCLAVASVVVSISGADAQKRGPRTLDIEWIDVEGGAATLIVTPAQETVLVDAGWPGFEGRDAKRIKAALDRRGLTKVDHLIATHYHVDHYGGIPDLVKVLPVAYFYDHGPMKELQEDPKFPERYAAYRMAAKNQTRTLQAGSRIGLKTVSGAKLSLTVLAARAAMTTLPSPQPQNPACAEATGKADDPSDNARSIVLLLQFGGFQFFDAGDLTWNVEAQLVCPADRVGKVDVYQVTHHGLSTSNNPVVLKTLAPTVAIMNNGPRKGGEGDVVKTLLALPSLQALFALHRNVATTAGENAAPELIANLEEQGDAGHSITLSMDPAAGSYTVTNGRTGESRRFEVK
jgi:competence protein ComEC